MVQPGENKPFMTDHDMIAEIRTDLRELKARFYEFTDSAVTKAEFDMWEAARRTTIRWAIGTIISILAVAATLVAIILTSAQ